MQGRQNDFKFPQAVVQVFPESSLLDGQLQVLVGCRHNPYVSVFLPVATYGNIGAFLQGTQEHTLYLHGEVPHLIKKQSTAAGCFKKALSVCGRSCKRPLHMPEKERGCKLFGNDATVYRQERLFPAFAGIMNTLCYGFLARSARSKNQDGNVEWSNRTGQILHVFHLMAVPGQDFLVLSIYDRARTQDVLYQTLQLIHLNRFGQIVLRPHLDGTDRIWDGGISGHDDEGNIYPFSLHPFEQRYAVPFRKTVIGKDKIERLLFQKLPRTGFVYCRHGLIAVFLEPFLLLSGQLTRL